MKPIAYLTLLALTVAFFTGCWLAVWLLSLVIEFVRRKFR